MEYHAEKIANNVHLLERTIDDNHIPQSRSFKLQSINHGFLNKFISHIIAQVQLMTLTEMNLSRQSNSGNCSLAFNDDTASADTDTFYNYMDSDTIDRCMFQYM